MKPRNDYPIFRPGDAVLDQHGRRGYIVRAHYWGAHRWYTARFPGRGQVIKSQGELRADNRQDQLFPWPRQIGGDE